MSKDSKLKNNFYKRERKLDLNNDFYNEDEIMKNIRKENKNLSYNNINNLHINIGNENNEENNKKININDDNKKEKNKELNKLISYEQYIVEEEDSQNSEQDKELPLITLNLISICQCCKNRFDKNIYTPYLLKCGHFFCINCIKQYFTHPTGIVCPTDGLVAKSIKELKLLKNLIIDSKRPTLNDIKKKMNIFKKMDIPKNNTIKNNNYINNYCLIHQNQKKSHLINETNEIICIYCAFEKLKSNPNLQITEIKEKYNEFNNVIENIVNNCQKNIELIQHMMQLINKNKENEEKKINKFFNNLIEIIQTLKYQKVQQIENIYIENMHNLEKKMLVFNEIIEQGEEFIKNIEEEDNMIKNYKNLLFNYNIILKLNKSNNDDNINNKIKYIKFNNKKEMTINEYLNNITNFNIIYKIIKYIKTDIPHLKEEKKKIELIEKKPNEDVKVEKINNKSYDINDSNSVSKKYYKRVENNKNIFKNFKKIYDHKIKNKINNSNKLINENNYVDTNDTQYHMTNSLENYNVNKTNNNKSKSSNIIIKTPRLKREFEKKYDENRKIFGNNKPHINKNKLLESYYELKSEKSISYNNYCAGDTNTDNKKSKSSFNNLNILNNFYNLNYTRRTPNNTYRKNRIMSHFNSNNKIYCF